MKYFFSLAIALCLIAGTAMAAQLTVTQEGSFDYTIRKQINDNFDELYDVVIEGAADLVGDGNDQLYGFLQDQVASTTVTITAAQAGKTFVSNSADVMTLPEASTVLGARYTFVCGTADDFDINPADGTDAIGSVSTTNGTTAVVTLAPAAGDAIRCTDIGGSITLEAVGANLWAQVAGGNGVWTDVN